MEDESVHSAIARVTVIPISMTIVCRGNGGANNKDSSFSETYSSTPYLQR